MKKTMYTHDLTVKEDLQKQKQAHVDRLLKEKEIYEHELSNLKQKTDQLKSDMQALDQILMETNAAILSGQDALSALQKELSGVFALAFGKKRELKDKIDTKDSELTALRQKLSDLKLKKALLQGSRDFAELDLIQGKYNDADRTFLLEQEALTALSSEISVLKNLLTETETALQKETEAETEKREEARLQEEAARLAEEQRKAEETAQSAEKQDVPPAAPENEPGLTAALSADPALAAAINSALEKLEAYFPEHKIFAFDSIDGELRERFSLLSLKAGYPTPAGLFHAYGYEVITGDAVRALRSQVIYTPGKEPDCIKPKIESMLQRLTQYYPDHIINRSIVSEHKKLSQRISGMYQWLGYQSSAAMLDAYGFQYLAFADQGPLNGRPELNYQPMLDALTEKYRTEPKPTSIGQLIFENPDYKGNLKTLSNKSAELFGMTLKRHLEEIGILESKKAAPKSTGPKIPATKSDVLEVFKERYLSADPANNHPEDLDAAVDTFVIKQNKAGELYILQTTRQCTSVTIPYGIDFISSGAFSGQNQLTDVTISASLSEIPENCFADCPMLSQVTLPPHLTTLQAGAFRNCPSLREIRIPASVYQIFNEAFAGCSALESVTIENPAVMVGEDVFSGCPFTYTQAGIPTDSKSFTYTLDRKGNATLTGYTGKEESIFLPGIIDGHPVTTIGKGAFRDHKNLVEVSMPDYITVMQGDAFRDCISLKKIHLSEQFSKIVTSTFKGCIGLTELNIPDAVTELKTSTFEDAPLSTLHIGKGLTTVDSRSFVRSDPEHPNKGRSVRNLTINPENSFLTSLDTLILSKDGKTLLACMNPTGSSRIPDTVTSIAPYAFFGLHLTGLRLPDSIVEIGEYAFSETSLRTVSFGTNLRKIADYAFYCCQKLSSVLFEEGIEELGDHAFRHCPIVSLTLPASLRRMGNCCFDILTGFHNEERRFSLHISPENPWLKTDGEALYQISGSEQILQTLYAPIFYQYYYEDDPQEMTYTVLPNTTQIAAGAFQYGSSLYQVTLPDSLRVIGDHAFNQCTHLNKINLPDSLEIIGEGAFTETAIEHLHLPAALREIGENALLTGSEWQQPQSKLRMTADSRNPFFFIENQMLFRKKDDNTCAVVRYFGNDDTVTIPNQVTEIEAGAFMKSSVREICIPASVRSVGNHAFSNCFSLTRLRVSFAEPENGKTCAVIYLPEQSDHDMVYGIEGPRDQYMDCIRIGETGNLFDFVKYDSLFDSIQTTKDKILIAADRLKSSIQLVPLYREKYLTYLKRHAKKATEIVITYDDLEGLHTLAELEIFTGTNIDACIELANKSKKTEILSYLMNFKNKNIGMEEDYDL